ncbi:MAG: hypothetical protein IKN72_01040 [Clostridia bacterium]|nr:hypothetical protein [Clostridia bacterium]
MAWGPSFLLFEKNHPSLFNLHRNKDESINTIVDFEEDVKRERNLSAVLCAMGRKSDMKNGAPYEKQKNRAAGLLQSLPLGHFDLQNWY